MKILFIGICNFVDYPLGGQLSFAKHLTRAMKGGIDLVACTTERNEPLRKWTTKRIEGYDYRVFNICYEENTDKKPFIPRRITIFNYVKRYHHLIRFCDYDCIMLQEPEILLALPKRVLRKICLIQPGVGNPLQISRYPWARKFACLYDKVFFNYAKYCRCILAAADSSAIKRFAERSKGQVDVKNVKQFPTRYDADIFNLKDKRMLRAKYNIPLETTVFVTTGRLNWFKGWKLMIDAFENFIKKSDGIDALLIFIGDGEENDKIREYADNKRLGSNVILLGRKPLDVVAEYLSLSDEFIMGSFAEGWSTSLVEAVASCLPCVVTNFSSAADMVKNGYNGYVVDSRSEKEFARRMYDALHLDKTKIAQASEDCQKLSVQKMKEELMKTIAQYYNNEQICK